MIRISPFTHPRHSIHQLAEELQKVSQAVTDLQTAVTALEAQDAAIKTAITDLVAQVAALQAAGTDAAAIEAAVANINTVVSDLQTAAANDPGPQA